MCPNCYSVKKKAPVEENPFQTHVLTSTASGDVIQDLPMYSKTKVHSMSLVDLGEFNYSRRLNPFICFVCLDQRVLPIAQS